MDVSRTPDFVLKAWKSADIVDSEHIRALRIPPDPEASSTKVCSPIFASNFFGISMPLLSYNL
jgi:hypothetical protein